MADVVQYRLERMVNELDDLEKRGLFSRLEIGEIVKQRRKFEYRLKRHCPLKQDYLAYIEYEKQLDSLRILRKKAVARQLKKKGNKRLKKSVSDQAGLSRILNIYRLAVMRFKGDVDLWFQYLEFCREKRNGRMKKALAQVIRYHPKVPGIWIYAAAWEFDYNLNVTAARALMQNGLRVCPKSEDLWVEYLRMELTYLNKLKARKIALGEDERLLTRDQANAAEKIWREENKDSFMALDDKEVRDLSNVENGESKEQVHALEEQGSVILRTIYSSAVEALPANLNLRKQFFEIAEVTNISHSEDLRVEILSDMKRDFASEPDYWDWLARLDAGNPRSVHEMDDKAMSSWLNKAIQVYEEALETVPSSKMFNLYIKFLLDIIFHKDEAANNSMPVCASGHALDAISHLLKVFERAETMGCLTENLACEHVSVLLQLGGVDEARKLAEKFSSGKLSVSVQLWVLRLSIEMKCIATKSSSPSKADLEFIFELLRNVLVKVSISEAENLWLMALKFFANRKKYFDKLVEISVVSLMKDGGSESGFSLSSAIVNFSLQKGVQHARDMYKRFLALPHPGLTLFRNCIEMELNLASFDKDCVLNARKLFESALTTYDQDVSLWQDYYNMEIKMGTSESSSAVYWRARKMLKDAAACIVSPAL